VVDTAIIYSTWQVMVVSILVDDLTHCIPSSTLLVELP